ncbi:MAG TPA: hypothetical protein VNP96_02690 [Solirubrobacterales bacterium]|nr:hypothetical protein [Solirubrobacterales bacterium]
MRSRKRLAAAVMTLAVGMALVGSASASATQYTVLCKVDEAPCKSGNVEDGGVKIAAKSTNAEIKFTYLGVPLSVTCASSEWSESFTLQKKGNPRLEGRVAALDFKGCQTESKNPCTIGVLNLQYKLLFEYQPGGGWLVLTEYSNGNVPGAYAECGSLINCNYYVSEWDEELPEQSVAFLSVTNGETFAQFHAQGVSMNEMTGPNCKTKDVYLYATYILSEPNPLWVSYVE